MKHWYVNIVHDQRTWLSLGIMGKPNRSYKIVGEGLQLCQCFPVRSSVIIQDTRVSRPYFVLEKGF